jgi:hypothetical protein
MMHQTFSDEFKEIEFGCSSHVVNLNYENLDVILAVNLDVNRQPTLL